MNRLPAWWLLLLLAAFAVGVVGLLQTRLARGDIYPPGSTLRADPLGARAFHDTLAQFTPVSRHLQPLNALGDGRGATLFFLGTDPADLKLPERDFKHLERFVNEGGRLVLALRPDPGSLWHRLWRAAEDGRYSGTNPPAGRRARGRPAKQEQDSSEAPTVRLPEQWAFRLHEPALDDEVGELKGVTVRRQTDDALPARLTWYSPSYLEATDPAWRSLYTRDGDRPVALERRVGRGTVVVLTDTWHFTNEALRDDRQPAWLAWLVGAQQRVIFDETHHGIREEPGVAALARRYRLHGVFAALLGLAGLFIWRNSTSFPPAEPASARVAEEVTAVRGREAAAGFVSLLRRNLPVAGLAAVCFAEWRRACARATPPARLQAVEAAFAAEGARSTTGKAVTALHRKLTQLLHRTDPPS
jgi:hypothetical protein